MLIILQYLTEELGTADWDLVLQLQRIWACSKGMDDTDDELEDQELEAHYMYMAKIQEVILDADDNYGPIFNIEPLEKDDPMFQKERELLASLIKQMKIEIDESKQNKKSLESSNKALREANSFLNIELKRYKESDFVKNVELKCAKAYGLLAEP
ncbi:hypothetical protein Tco_1221139 [Tanacetum coccineum]